MVAMEAYENVTRDKFCPKQGRLRREKAAAAAGKVLPRDGERYFFLEEAPGD
jgi:hypothetical protein